MFQASASSVNSGEVSALFLACSEFDFSENDAYRARMPSRSISKKLSSRPGFSSTSILGVSANNEVR